MQAYLYHNAYLRKYAHSKKTLIHRRFLICVATVQFDNLLQIICLKSVKNQINKIFEELREDEETNRVVAKKIINHIEEGGENFYGNCFIAAIAYKMCNLSVKLVVGSAGWIGKDGKPHWEYG